MRIHKFLADRGVCSRRKAEELVAQGLVEVNGQIARIGQSVDPAVDRVKANGKPVVSQDARKIALVMNKPKGVVCTNADDLGAQTVFDLLPSQYRKLHLYCCGRLDKESEGLVVLTNDGEFKQALTHPSGNIVKRYQVAVNRAIDPSVAAQFIKGVHSEGEVLRAQKIVLESAGPDASRRAEIRLTQGKKRQIRRMFEEFGYYVKTLRRTQIGAFVLRKIPLGAARLLTQKERQMLLKTSNVIEEPVSLRPLRREATPTARQRRYAEQKERAQRPDNRPFSKRKLVNAKEGDNILPPRTRRTGTRSFSEKQPARARPTASPVPRDSRGRSRRTGAARPKDRARY